LTTVDWVLIGILVVTAGWGWSRGGIAFLTGLVAFALATAIVSPATDQIARFLGKGLGLEAKMAAAIGQQIGLPAMAGTAPAAGMSQGQWAQVIANMPLPAAYKAALTAQVTKAAAGATAAGLSAAQLVINQLVQNILHGLAFFGGILLLGFGLSLGGRLLSGLLNQIPLVGTANRLVGGAIGLLGGLMVVLLIVAVVGPALQVTGSPAGLAIMNAKLAPTFLSIWQGVGGLFLGGGKQVWNA
jgi:uncharacterized membrane protein required for colicin V production